MSESTFVQNHVDLQHILKIATRINDANRILLLGGDMAFSLVSYMEYHLKPEWSLAGPSSRPQ